MNKLALITGGTSGIGRSFADYFAKQGFDLILTGRNKSSLPIKEELEKKYKIKVKIILADFKKISDIRKIEKHVKDLDISILVNNAGFGNKTSFFEDSMENHVEMINTHIMATTRLTHLIGNKMIQRKKGTIINVSSLGAIVQLKSSIMYSATKSFLIPFTKLIHKNLKKHNIRVQVLIPGFVKTSFHKREKANKFLIFPISPEEVIRESIKCLNKGRIICVPGHISKLTYRIFSH